MSIVDRGNHHEVDEFLRHQLDVFEAANVAGVVLDELHINDREERLALLPSLIISTSLFEVAERLGGFQDHLKDIAKDLDYITRKGVAVEHIS